MRKLLHLAFPFSISLDCLILNQANDIVIVLLLLIHLILFSSTHFSMSVYLAEHVRVGVVLQEHSGGARVVVTSGDVEGGEPDLALGAIVDEQCNDIFMALLQSYCEGSEAVLREEAARNSMEVITEKRRENGEGRHHAILYEI